ncbi:MAG: ABC transporter ATP-binding protein [Phycisphaerales bacterium JB043]
MTTASPAQTDTQAPRQNDITVVARGLVKRYGDLVAVDELDLEARAGQCLGVLGPNGAGKTTTIEMLEGLKKPDSGTIEVLGHTWDNNPRSIQEHIGVQLQETDFQDKLTVFEMLRLFQSFYSNTRTIDEVIETIGLQEKRNDYAKTLSGGQRQRLSIGCALINKPKILFLDEPTTGLDPQARRRLWEIVESFKSEGGTVILTTHYMEEAEILADDLLIVDHGKAIARGTPPSIIATLHVENVVRFSVQGHEARILSEQELQRLEGVHEVRYDGTSVVLSVVSTQEVISGLFAMMDERSLVLEDLRTHRPTLEDVFVSMTGKHLRDG